MSTFTRSPVPGSQLTFEGITQRFSRLDSSEPFLALKHVDLTVDDGRFVAVIGRSGCGKSTLLRLAGGFVIPSEGVVRHLGQPIVGPDYSRGFVFQADAVFPWLTVRRNVEFGPKSRGVPRGERRQIAEHWCQVVGLGDFVDAFPKELSGGMRKRVDLARVYANDPGVLLMDEPFGALDAQTKEHMQRELLDLWEGSGKTVMFVTHDVDEAVFLADEIVVMSSSPGQIADRLIVDLPRPRDDDTRYSSDFGELAQSVRSRMAQINRPQEQPREPENPGPE